MGVADRPLRITFVLPFAALSGGVRVIATYAKVLTDQGHEVFVVSAARSKRGRLRKLWRRLVGRPVKYKQHSPLFAPLGARHIFYDPDRPFDPDVVPDGDAVFATWWRTADMVAALPPAKGAKFYLLQDYEAFSFQPVDQVAASYQLPMHKIAVSSYIRDAIVARHGPTEIEVINNAVDLDQFAAPPREKSDALVVGFLYNTHPRKRMDVVIEAIKQARARYPDLQCIAFGGLPPSPKQPLPDWVRFHQAPAQDQIPQLYQACDLWLFPSEHEGFGLPLLEAMASRTPVLASPAGAAPDLIDEQNGTLLPAGADAQVFCNHILRFAAMDPAEWQRYSQAAFQTAQHNDWLRSANRLAKAIRRAAPDRQEAAGNTV